MQNAEVPILDLFILHTPPTHTHPEKKKKRAGNRVRGGRRVYLQRKHSSSLTVGYMSSRGREEGEQSVISLVRHRCTQSAVCAFLYNSPQTLSLMKSIKLTLSHGEDQARGTSAVKVVIRGRRWLDEQGEDLLMATSALPFMQRIRTTHAALQAPWAVSQHLLSSLFQLSSAGFAVVKAPCIYKQDGELTGEHDACSCHEKCGQQP
ncbi:uncharacterized protein LOC114014668 isoform X2 [Falco cherrug]|uniref:uncharacterized protein LOC114014668 isoform X2 n=1 Tax=Falco cherrug TaxID=345164 RepID=UPI002478BA6F|nr:uncharacterized protein LOC114014668 isoform X2 [Falco cherrug]